MMYDALASLVKIPWLWFIYDCRVVIYDCRAVIYDCSVVIYDRAYLESLKIYKASHLKLLSEFTRQDLFSFELNHSNKLWRP